MQANQRLNHRVISIKADFNFYKFRNRNFFNLIEKAFFDASLLEKLYFPEDQK
jgi:hypothetical protein